MSTPGLCSAVLAFASLTAMACGAGGGNADCPVDPSYHPAIDPADFSAPVDNPFWPLTPGTVSSFEGAGERSDFTVTDETKVILGVPAIRVREHVTLDGATIEDVQHWYLADNDGNIWNLGEDFKEYEEGIQITASAWEAGVDGAEAGIVMYATPPAAGESNRLEYAPCVAEGTAEIVSTAATVSVPFGDYENCRQIKETTRLEPDVQEHKYYCADVGFVLEVDITNGERIELVDHTP